MNKKVAAIGVLLLLGFMLTQVPVRAATFNIGNGKIGILIAAINTAKSNNESDTINLAPLGRYSFSRPYTTPFVLEALPAIEDDVDGLDLTINGNGAIIETNVIGGTSPFRALSVREAQVIIKDLEIRDISLYKDGG